MTTSWQPSGSEHPAPSRSFELLAEPVQRWIWRTGWAALYDIQERSIPLLHGANEDVIIAAPTGGGKTEAAFLPLISRTIEDDAPGSGFDLLYVSPLRALINDQFRRLRDLCDAADLPVHPWHSDISAAIKANARKNPRGILLITPESLEATFVLRGLEVPRLFGRLVCVVIDELHAFLDTERGVQVRSLINRLECATRRRIRRVGLSATLGDMDLARRYLRPDDPEAVAIVCSPSDGPGLRLQLRGYRQTGEDAQSQIDQQHPSGTDRAIADHLFAKLRGATNLVFAGQRQNVEMLADLFRRKSEQLGVPNEFLPHHANLAGDHRSFVERKLRDKAMAMTAVCTTTLELGIDIGDIECVAQVGPPVSVTSLRQRLGRSGRRGQPAVLRMYQTERDIDAATHPIDALRLNLVRSIAMVELLLEGWNESPRPEALHLSTLMHQVLSVIAERGGVGAPRLFHILCERGPFRRIPKALFARLLRRIGDPEVALIEQSPDGTLLLGRVGERVVEHYGFYAVFNTPDEYRVLFDGRPLGTIPTVMPLVPDTTIIFSGRRWRIVAIHDRDKVVEVAEDATGRPPPFGGDLVGIVDDPVVARMRSVLEAESVPRYLDQEATELLREGRSTYRRLELARRHVVDLGDNHHLLATWDGTIRTTTLALALRSHGFTVAIHDGFLDVKDRRPEHDRLTSILSMLAVEPGPDGTDLASGMSAIESEKFHRYLSRDLLILDVVASKMAPDAVPEMARRLLTEWREPKWTTSKLAVKHETLVPDGPSGRICERDHRARHAGR